MSDIIQQSSDEHVNLLRRIILKQDLQAKILYKMYELLDKQTKILQDVLKEVRK